MSLDLQHHAWFNAACLGAFRCLATRSVQAGWSTVDVELSFDPCAENR